MFVIRSSVNSGNCNIVYIFKTLSWSVRSKKIYYVSRTNTLQLQCLGVFFWVAKLRWRRIFWKLRSKAKKLTNVYKQHSRTLSRKVIMTWPQWCKIAYKRDKQPRVFPIWCITPYELPVAWKTFKVIFKFGTVSNQQL